MFNHQAAGQAAARPQALEGLTGLATESVSYRRSRYLQLEGELNGCMFLVGSGWIVGSIILPTGDRQIVSLYLPGDLIGVQDLFNKGATESLSAVCDASVRKIDRMDAHQALARDHNLALALLRISASSTVAAKAQLTSIGRTSAVARISALLVQLATRLGSESSSSTRKFECLLNQEHIGDMTGLTAVHVNRSLRKLAERGLIERHNTTVIIPDLDALRIESDLARRSANA